MRSIRECKMYFIDRNDALLEARKRKESDGVNIIAYRERQCEHGYCQETLITSKSGRLFVISIEPVGSIWKLVVKKAGYDEMSKEKWDVYFATKD